MLIKISWKALVNTYKIRSTHLIINQIILFTTSTMPHALLGISKHVNGFIMSNFILVHIVYVIAQVFSPVVEY